MRIAVVCFAEKSRSRVPPIAQALARGIQAAGVRAELLDGIRDRGKNLQPYGAFALCVETRSFFSTGLSAQIAPFIAAAGNLGGKRGYAYLAGPALRPRKALAGLMRIMEGKGIFLRYSEALTSPARSEELGRMMGG